ncbi:thiol:disulfide interchange protein DsbA/DsbL [Dyella sp. BiH032]|uniref:thiol:disulfide interchange protein DsbA/DsbL n=1 Tax=Dyella sp. BiH032 TaxID=3075430 RepID=UPI0028935CF6|nr:thiol:disulfide interchange protein DsbA/DsbL [Dyella sp. BiH032]WNL46764.1 thiol:disulfide interchange protein DsbA/DsbL [Dyella sp. BiH032]
MLKRLPFLFVSMLAIAACSQGSDNGTAAQQPAPAATPAASASATPAPATAATASAPASAGTAAAAPDNAKTETPAPSDAAAPAGKAEPFVDDGKWVEGKHYFRIEPAQPKVTNTDKIEVTEVFSYGCPACNQFRPTMVQLVKALPAGTQVAYLPVSFNPAENFPMFQRAYYAAEALGVAQKSHEAIYDAIWNTRELTSYKASGNALRPISELPTIEDAAKVYAKFGVDPKEFVAVANSFTINTKMKRADELVRTYGVDSTPTLVVDGKYRFTAGSAGGYEQSIELAKWLVAKEAAGK